MNKPIAILAAGVLSLVGVFGLASAANATPVPSPSPTVSATTYDAVLWQTTTYNVKYPQTKKTVVNETTLTLPTLPTTCGTSYQGDVYVHSTAEAAWLASTTSLAGPDGAQDGAYLAPGGQGVAYNYVVNAVCPPAPPAPPVVDPEVCTVTGPAYAESPDHFAVKTAAGYQFTNQPLVAGAPAGSAPDGHPVDLIYPTTGNLQGFLSETIADKNVVGNGIFFRFILNLSADGGSAYNSFSVTDGTVTQSSVANVGSKAVLLGKTVAQVAALYPHNQIAGFGIETGSSYLSGDGALLTGLSGSCLNASFVDGVTPPAAPQAPTGIHTGDVPVSPLYPAAALVLGAGLVFAFRKRLAAKF